MDGVGGASFVVEQAVLQTCEEKSTLRATLQMSKRSKVIALPMFCAAALATACPARAQTLNDSYILP